MKNKFCILLDERNDWLRPYAIKFLNKKNINPSKHIFYDPKDTREFEKCFILGYTKILNKDEISDSCKYFIVHESSLPKGKGFAPLFWQIIEGKNKIDICLIELDFPVDYGRIALKKEIVLSGYELYDELRQKQAESTFDLINSFLLNPSEINFKKQVGESTKYKKRNKNDSKLDIDKSIIDNFNLLRTCNNEEWPAYFEINNQKYIIKIYKGDKNKKI